MNRVICVKGHFYDGDKYTSCPHCAEGAAAIEPNRFTVPRRENAEESERVHKREKKGLFHWKSEKEAQPVYPAVEKKTARYADSDESLDVKERSGKEDGDGQEPGAARLTQPSELQAVSESQELHILQPVPEPQPVSEQQSAGKERQSPDPSLSVAFARAAEPRRASEKPADEGKTIGFFSTGHSTEPPVGYLICVEGDDFGVGFPLKSGNNAIGRSQSMDVVVMDARVSREKQAFVMYEPYKREFYVKPGEGNGLCYFNNEVVLAPVKMKQFDMIMVGDTKLMLFPVCCEQFSWDDYIKSETRS